MTISHFPTIFAIALLVILPFTNGAFQQYAEMGICENVVTKEHRCAMQKSDCVPTHIDGKLNEAGEKWYTAHDQRLNGKDPCLCAETEIGACMNGDSFTCSPSKTGYCDSFNDFFGSLPADKGYCRCDSHSVNNVMTRTKYGACQDMSSMKNHFCAYSPNDCEGNHVWVEPEMAKNIVGMDCYCENVRIGGCIGGFTNFICATTEDQCYFDQYFPPHSLKELHGQTCNLCKAPITMKDELSDLKQVKQSGKLSAGAIAGICIASVVVAIGLTVIGVRKIKPRGPKELNPGVEVSPKSLSSNIT